MGFNGLIALDIDGTVTAEAHEIDPEVVDFLSTLKDWQIIFITGRSYTWSLSILQRLNFPHLLAVQNGAALIDMPSGKALSSKLLPFDLLNKMSELCDSEKTHFVIYSGYENNDICYFQPEKIPVADRSYLQARVKAIREDWRIIKSFDDLPVHQFASFKCFAKEPHARELSEKIESELGLHAPPNRDPFDPNYFVIQCTHPDATKGEVVKELKQKLKPKIVIVAGDDHNDLPMLKEANIKIVMETAPQKILDLADIIAPSANKNGIISALKKAINY